MKFRIIVEHDPETESYAAYCPELPECCSAGYTEEEALANAKEAIMLYLEPVPVNLKPHHSLAKAELWHSLFGHELSNRGWVNRPGGKQRRKSCP